MLRDIESVPNKEKDGTDGLLVEWEGSKEVEEKELVMRLVVMTK